MLLSAWRVLNGSSLQTSMPHDMSSAIDKIGNFWKEKALKELNETDGTKNVALKKLRVLIKEKNLKTFLTDEYLLRFLRARKFKPEKACQLLENYLNALKNDKDLFSVREALEDVELFENGWQCILKGRDKNGRAVLIFRPGMYHLISGKANRDKREKCVTVDQSFRMNFLSVEWALLDSQTQIAGLAAIIDLQGFSLVKHSLFLSPYHSMRTSSSVQDTVPIRLGAVHIINQPRYIDAVYALFRPFLKEKIKERIHFHGRKVEELEEHFSKDVLPVELGGIQTSLVLDDWKDRLLSRAEQILENDPSEL